jgi:molybdopterin molybdotransferase
MLRIEDALEIMLGLTLEIEAEELQLDQSLGRVLRESARADLDLPPFNRARMDGYALRAADTAGASEKQPVTLRAIGEVAAGDTFSGSVGQGEVVRIMTGAPVPLGADAVEKIELINVFDDGSIVFQEPVKLGRHITPLGSEARAGDIVVPAGERITPANAAVLASFGYQHVQVSRSPRVVLLSTGSELVEVGQRPGPAQIRNSNTYSLAGYAASAGCRIIGSGIVEDEVEATAHAIREAASKADVVMVSGGVSMGDYDLVKPVLRELGAEISVERVAMHPGKPTVFARLGETIIFGLPGNPVSSAVAFHLFARPVLLRMQCATEIHLPRVRATAIKGVKGAPPRRSHQPARLTIIDGRAEVEPVNWGGSSDLVAFAQANALIVVPEDRQRIEAGDTPEVIVLR